MVNLNKKMEILQLTETISAVRLLLKYLYGLAWDGLIPCVDGGHL